jgi:ankyrin repeat protein
LFVCFFFPLKKLNFPGERTLDNDRFVCRGLLKAALEGDWPAAEGLLEANGEHFRVPITDYERTVLHVAVIAQRTTFVEDFLKWIDTCDSFSNQEKKAVFELKTTYGYTALHHAVQSGIVRIAEELVKINSEPLLMTDASGDTPLNVAAFLGKAKMIKCLLYKTPLHQLTPVNSTKLLLWTIKNDLYGN